MSLNNIMRVTRRFSISKRKIAKEYSKIRYKLNIVYSLFCIAILVIFLISGASSGLKNIISSYIEKNWLITTIYFSLVLILFEIIVLPTNFHVGFLIEHKFKLSNQSITAWILENIKKTIVSLIIGLIFIHIIYYFLENYESIWWIYTSIIFILLGILFSHLVPILLIPIFYKLIPLENEVLKNKLLNLCKSINMQVKNVYKINLSKDTKKANAGLSGIGNTRCIILSDTLLEKFSLEEIEVIFSHELGHHYYKHIWKLIGIEIILTFFCLYFVDISLNYFGPLFNIIKISNIANLPLLALSFFIISFLFMPLKNTFSRTLEREADKFALNATQNPSSFISGMINIGDQNLSEIKTHLLIETYFYSHPPIIKRLKMGYSYFKTE
ncbi:MAG: M48 family metallopeptidase [bacterium]|nr:M48 family metallopeptidase [bacterium]